MPPISLSRMTFVPVSSSPASLNAVAPIAPANAYPPAVATVDIVTAVADETPKYIPAATPTAAPAAPAVATIAVTATAATATVATAFTIFFNDGQ